MQFAVLSILYYTLDASVWEWDDSVQHLEWKAQCWNWNFKELCHHDWFQMWGQMFLVAITIGTCSCAADWMQQPYDDDSFNIRKEYLDNVTLKCEDEFMVNKTYGVEYWLTPNLTHMYANDFVMYLTVDGYSMVSVSIHKFLKCLKCRLSCIYIMWWATESKGCGIST